MLNAQPETNISMVAGSKIIEASWVQSIEVSQTNILHTLNQYFFLKLYDFYMKLIFRHFC